jgi:electron transfer flavoprotein alpha subunit
VFTRPIYAGKAFLTVTLKSAPLIATLRPNVYAVESTPAPAGDIVAKDFAIPDEAVRGRVVEIVREKGEAIVSVR